MRFFIFIFYYVAAGVGRLVGVRSGFGVMRDIVSKVRGCESGDKVRSLKYLRCFGDRRSVLA